MTDEVNSLGEKLAIMLAEDWNLPPGTALEVDQALIGVDMALPASKDRARVLIIGLGENELARMGGLRVITSLEMTGDMMERMEEVAKQMAKRVEESSMGRALAFGKLYGVSAKEREVKLAKELVEAVKSKEKMSISEDRPRPYQCSPTWRGRKGKRR